MNNIPPASPTETPATKRLQWQRLALVAVFLLGLWLFLRLFSSVLTPFVVAAGLAYFLDPAVSRLARIGLRRRQPMARRAWCLRRDIIRRC